jgi:hypothetical protein
MIGLVDYGLGNIRAFLNVFAELQIPAVRCFTDKGIRAADRLILPGVGAVDLAMVRRNGWGLAPALGTGGGPAASGRTGTAVADPASPSPLGEGRPVRGLGATAPRPGTKERTSAVRDRAPGPPRLAP